ncbi:MAG TPA: class I SAM-dependent methyltransferase [Solirubrobacteraceae bacterium]|nr:class I SAM-dependent methyltransferase [Solirubrobacteraceae bacterium]
MTAAPEAPPRGATRAPAPSCVWCGSLGRPVAGRLAVCDACGTATTYPPPDEAELEAAYSGWYRPAGGRFAGGGDRLLRRSRATLARRLDEHAPAGPVLDVGCGEGALLDALHARGREALGLERTSARADVRAREVTAFHEREGEWAAVVFWHSLEHLRQPAAALARGCELLGPGGLLVVAVPNRASWQARAMGERWFALDIPRHLVHLPASALTDSVRARGLEIERVSYWRGGQVMFGWLQGIVAGLPGHLDLYDAIRQPEARSRRLTSRQRVAAVAAGVAASPLALALAGAEVAARAGGTVYLEARRP